MVAFLTEGRPSRYRLHGLLGLNTGHIYIQNHI